MSGYLRVKSNRNFPEIEILFVQVVHSVIHKQITILIILSPSTPKVSIYDHMTKKVFGERMNERMKEKEIETRGGKEGWRWVINELREENQKKKMKRKKYV